MNKKTQMSVHTIAMVILAIVALIAVLGLLLSLGVVKTGKVWQAQPTAPPCPQGWIQAWASSTNHTDMLNAGYDCTQSIVKGMVCCSH